MRVAPRVPTGAVLFAAIAVAAAGAAQRLPTTEPVTFNEHVAPIVLEHCAACHRPDGPAPFSLLSYAQVRARATQIAQVTRARYMPPWLPEPGGPRFAGERRLTDDEIVRLERWIADGAPEGKATELPSPPRWPPGWQLGEPDLVLAMPEPYTLPAGGPDVFRNFVIPVPVDARRFVKAVELRPGSGRVIHHAVLTVDRTRSSRQRDRADPQPGYDGMFPAQVESPDGHFIGWTPGKAPYVPGADMAWRLDRGTDLVLQLHMTPSGKPEVVPVRLGLFFTDQPPARFPAMIRVGSKALDIPAGDPAYETEDRFVLPVDAEVRSVYPHAHFLAREIEASATLPDGRTLRLLRIRAWDLNWQDEYRYAEPLALPPGTLITARFTFDNSAGNPRNPQSPPRRVAYGPRSTDEMGDVWLQVVPRSRHDLAVLRDAFAAHELRHDIAGYEATVRANPGDALARTRLGTFYSLAGRADAAAAAYRSALSLQPDLSLAHYNLGLVLQAAGRIDEAISHFREAAARDLHDAESHHAWGQVLERQGSIPDATAHYEEALRRWPDYADALVSYGNALYRQSRVEEAVARYRAALAIQPDHLAALNNLGIALARSGQADEAVEVLRHAVAVDPRDASSRTNLDAALALQRERVKRP